MLFRYAASLEPKTRLPSGKTLLTDVDQAICMVRASMNCFRLPPHLTVLEVPSDACCRAANTCKGFDSSPGSPLHSGEIQPCCTNFIVLTCMHADGQRVNALQGSRIYKDNIAKANDALIDVLEDSGAIVIGKTNTPEFGAGANTFNECGDARAYLVLQFLDSNNSKSCLHCQSDQSKYDSFLYQLYLCWMLINILLPSKCCTFCL